MRSRSDARQTIGERAYDVCIIGGGATGTGCALDAQDAVGLVRDVVVQPVGWEQVYSERADSQDAVGLVRDVVVQLVGWEQVYLGQADSQDAAGLVRDAAVQSADLGRADSRYVVAALVGLEQALRRVCSPRALAERQVVLVPAGPRALRARPDSLRELPAWFLLDELPWHCSVVAALHFQDALRWSRGDALPELE